MTSITPRASDVISQTMTASMTSNVRRTSGVGSTPPPSGAQSSTSSTWLTEVAALPAPLCLTSDLLRTVCLTRERLSEWHQRFRSRLFQLIVGFHVRCRQEDTADGQCHYRVGYIKAIRADWSIELDPKPFQGLTGTEKEVTCAVAPALTNYDCVSNSRMTEEEYKIFVQSVAPSTTAQHALLLHVVRMRERLHMIECILMKDPEYPPRRKSLNEGKPLAGGSMCSDTPSCKPSSSKSESDGKASHTAVKSYVFSTNVLLLSEDGSVGSGPCSMTVPVTELLRNAIGVSGVLDPDTPRATNPSGGIPPGKPMSTSSHFRGREPEDKVASDTTSVLLTDLERYIASPTLPQNNDTWRLYHSVLAAGRSSGFTSFRYADPMGVAQMTLQVLNLAKETLSNESLYHNIASPVYVFGDIHGNFVDLQFFLSRLVTFDDIALRYGSHNLLFLGDYVDRGTCSYECIILLLILKVINPKKVVLLRGNHESPEVNGDLDCYGYSSFKYQCMDRFGRERGLEIWSRFNDVFAHFPLCASIDQRIFCVHGGLPFYAGGEDHRLEILKSPSFPRFPQVQCDVPTQRELRVMVNDLLWSDPAMRGTTLDEHGFGPNPRGPDIRSFGSRAVDEFCEHFGFQFIFRAHQEKADGLRLSDSARVLTIFSSSDYAGHQNGAGCIFVHDGKIRLVIKKPKNSATSVEVGSGGGATGGGISPNQRSTGIAASNLRGRGSPSATVSNSNALGTIVTTPRSSRISPTAAPRSPGGNNLLSHFLR